MALLAGWGVVGDCAGRTEGEGDTPPLKRAPEARENDVLEPEWQLQGAAFVLSGLLDDSNAWPRGQRATSGKDYVGVPSD